MALLPKLSVDDFDLIEDTSQFNENLIKNYNKQNDKGYFLEADVLYSEKLHNFQWWFTDFTWINKDWKCRKACS